MEGVDQIFAGESVPHLSIRGELSDGQFRLDGIDMNHSAATVGLSGDIDLVKSVAELKIVASIPDASRCPQSSGTLFGPSRWRNRPTAAERG